jgi:diguanylate cyclase (GGDEF)-like protein/putative nucleotidyltransferase with HDIG domain
MPLIQIFFSAMPFVALLTYCLLLLFFGISQKDKYIRAFMLMLVALIVWTASAVFMSIKLYPSVLFWDRIMVTGMLAVPFFIYYFVSIFTNSLNISRAIIWGIFTIVMIVINLSGYVVTEANTIINMLTINGMTYKANEFQYSLGWGAIPVYLFMFVFVYAILKKARASVREGNKTYQQTAPVIIGIEIMFLGCLCNVIPAIGKYPIDLLACFINALLIFVAIYKYRLVELRFMLTKGLVYGIFTSLVTIAYLAVVFFLENHVGIKYQNTIPYFTTITALLVAIILQPLYRLAGMLVDKIFYKADYSQRQALRHFSSNISNKLDLNSIGTELIEAVQVALHSKQILVLMKNEEENHYSVFQTSSRVYKPELEISFENPMIKWLAQNKTGLSRDELNSQPFFKSMWEKEKRELHDLNIELIIPIIIGSDIISLLMLTGKANNTAYTLDDLDLLNYLGASTAVAFENARLYARSLEEAITDNLTKLRNQRYFYKAMAEQMEQIGSAEFSLLMLDLDSFKLYNDLFGHIEGDYALEIIAKIMVGIVGQKGDVCRYGGEEFTVMLPYHDSKRAFDVAETIRKEIQSYFFNLDDVTQRFLTVSIGICTYPHAAPNTQELLRRADLAMYTAKNQGKNQTVIYTPREVTGVPYFKDRENKANAPAYAATIYALTAAIDAKDHYTFGHSQRVAEYATILASNMALDNAHVEILREAALLHDIGKLSIPENILTKAGRLTDEEFEIVKKHVEMSITIIKHLPSLNHVIPAVIGHHERWDGKGYPRGLKGENIPISARCLAITDSFDAMTSNRPYRAGLTVTAALNEIRNSIGTQFDPAMGSLFIKLVQDGSIKVDKRIEIKSIS